MKLFYCVLLFLSFCAIRLVTGRIGVKVEVTMAQREQVQAMIKGDKVVIFSKTYCPYCTMAKKAFETLKQNATIIELDNRDDGPAIQEILGEITGASSVPRVFVNGNFIGGGTDVKKMHENGSLQTLLAQ